MSSAQTIALFGGAGLFFALQALYWTLRSLRQRSGHRVEQRLRLGGTGPGASDHALDKRTWLGRTRLGSRLNDVLASAGLTMTAEQLLLRGLFLLAGLWGVVAATSGSAATGLALSLVVTAGAWLYIQGRRAARVRRTNQQLPSALEVMRSALSAGRTLDQALQVAAEEVANPLGEELRRCHEQFEKGRPMAEALQELGQRNPECSSMQTFVQAVLVLRRAGGNMVPVLENIIETLRAQAAYEARYRALTSEARVSGMILGLLPGVVAATMLLVQPGYLSVLVTDSRGRVILGIGLCMWALGVLWLRKLTKPTG